MTKRDLQLPLLTLASALTLACAITAQAPTIRRTTPVKVEPRDYRLGFGLAGTIPERAFKLKFGREEVLLWDLDGDGALTPGASDGLSLEGLPFIVRLPEVLLLPVGQFRFAAHKGTQLAQTRELADQPDEWIAAAATMTRLRVSHGKTPLRLDLQASIECIQHCNYLRLNPPSTTGASPHDEDAGREGYTPGGAAAGSSSCIWEVQDIARSIEAQVASIWHCEPIMDPTATAFGCCAEHGWELTRPLGGSRFTPFVHPADGAEHVPTEFGPGGEYPNPVPGTDHAQGCGYPVFARLAEDEGRLIGVTLVDEGGESVTGTSSCPKAPANPIWPTNSGCAAFVPAAPLKAGTRYTATFAFEGGRLLTWQFRTAPAEGRRLTAWHYTPMPDATPINPAEFLGEPSRDK